MSWRLGLSVALGLALLGQAATASAYCLTRGCNEATQDCAIDANGCVIGPDSPILHWDSSCVSFDVQQDGSSLRGISYEAANDAIHDAFSEWLNADCNGRSPSITISDYGAVECRTPEYNQDAGNANVFMFRDDSWPYENSDDTLALTTLIFDADSGRIYDADVEINTFESAMAIAPLDQPIGHSEIDFRSVITHEIGHFLGLSHSWESGSTMRPSYAPGNTQMASIEQDDVNGICAALPPGRGTGSSSCEPRHGFSSQCAIDDSSCSTAPGRGRSNGWLLVVAGVSSTLLTRLRRAGRRRAANPGPRSGLGSAS
jgi:hypothetical protein